MKVSYPFSFKGAVLEKNMAPLVIRDVDFKGPLLAGHVLVKLKYSGICGKQIEEINGTGGADPFLPHMLGHEGCGEVMDTGPGVTKVKKEDMVVLHWVKGSGIHSATPYYNLKGTDSRINSGWVTTFNDYAVVSENRLTLIPRNSDPLISALFGCVVTTGVGVIMNEVRPQPHDTVVIAGCGGVGLCAVQAAHILRPDKIIAVDCNPKALALARDFGATDVVDSRQEDVAGKVKELTSGKGASKVVVATGNPKAIEQALEACSVPGECFLVGVPPKGEKIEIEAYPIMHKRNIFGSLGGGTWPDRDIPGYMALQERGLLNLEKLVARVFPFERINEAIGMMCSTTPGRCMIKF